MGFLSSSVNFTITLYLSVMHVCKHTHNNIINYWNGQSFHDNQKTKLHCSCMETFVFMHTRALKICSVNSVYTLSQTVYNKYCSMEPYFNNLCTSTERLLNCLTTCATETQFSLGVIVQKYVDIADMLLPGFLKLLLSGNLVCRVNNNQFKKLHSFSFSVYVNCH